MSVQQDMKEKIEAENIKYANILMNLIQEVDENQMPKTRIKAELIGEITEWVIEEETN